MALQRQPLEHGRRLPIAESTDDICVESDTEPLRLNTTEINFLISNKISKRWMQVGLCLGVSQDNMDVIAINHHRDVERCVLNMISTWLINDKEASWTKLAQAVGSHSGGRNSSLAAEILKAAYKTKHPSDHTRQFAKYVHLGT